MSVTPRRLEKMKALTKLQRLKLEGCDRTAQGLAGLRAARPKLRVFQGAWEAKAANFRNN